MNAEELLERIDLIDLTYVEEAKGLRNRPKNLWGYYAGIAACFVVCLISGGISLIRSMGTGSLKESGQASEVASIFGGTGGMADLVLLLLFLVSLLAAVFLLFQVLSRKHRADSREEGSK